MSRASNIFDYQKRVSQRLLAWSIASIALGLWLTRKQDSNQQGFGQQAVAWGAIDAVIAAGGWAASQKRSQADDALTAAVQDKERRSLRRLLWINAGLDVLYMLGGWLWARRPDPQNRGWAGHGWGVVVQGAFLFVFDLVHALRLHGEVATHREDKQP